MDLKDLSKWQKDGAPSHSASSGQHKPKDLGERPSLGAGRCLSVNRSETLHYSIWRLLQGEVQGVPPPIAEALKAHIVKT